MKNWLLKLARLQERFPLVVIASVFFIGLCFLGFALQLETEPSLDVIFSDESESLFLKNLVKEEFGGGDTLFLMVEVDEENVDEDRVQDVG